MDDEPRYTLPEARREIARRECAFHGHDWRVVIAGTGQPVAITCERCGQAHEVVASTAHTPHTPRSD